MPTAVELLYAPRLKLERACHHINDLNGRIDNLLAERPFKLMERFRRKVGKITYRVKAEKTVPKEFSLIIGDAVHNMRTALDMTLFAMAGNIAPKIHFPLAKEATGLKAAIKEGYVKSAGKKVVEAICALEPYPGGKGTPLYTVHALDIKDKHRLLILAAQRATFVTGTPNEAFLKPFLKSPPRPGITIILDGSEDKDILTVKRGFVLRDMRDTEQEAKIQPTFVIAFDEDEALPGLSVIQVLRTCAEEVNRAVETLVNAFLDPDNKDI
jgi:hypothetical protein